MYFFVAEVVKHALCHFAVVSRCPFDEIACTANRVEGQQWWMGGVQLWHEDIKSTHQQPSPPLGVGPPIVIAICVDLALGAPQGRSWGRLQAAGWAWGLPGGCRGVEAKMLGGRGEGGGATPPTQVLELACVALGCPT